MSWAFLVTSLIIIATPGTGAILTIAAGIRGGKTLSLVTAFGCTLGIVPHLVAAITGTDAASLPQMLTLSGIFMALTLLVFAVYGLAASFFRRHLVERPTITRRIQKGFALGYVGIGVGLATTHR